MLQGASGVARATDPGRDVGGIERGDRSPRRLFADEAGVLWTAELRRPRQERWPDKAATPLILFWSETRACLATLREASGLRDLSEEELRRHLRTCLAG